LLQGVFRSVVTQLVELCCTKHRRGLQGNFDYFLACDKHDIGSFATTATHTAASAMLCSRVGAMLQQSGGTPPLLLVAAVLAAADRPQLGYDTLFCYNVGAELHGEGSRGAGEEIRTCAVA
jgi:hypothetical protein